MDKSLAENIDSNKRQNDYQKLLTSCENNSYSQLIAQPGTSVYYSLLSVNREQRFAISTVRAFAHEIKDIIKTCSDPAVALQKFAWWRGEVQQMASSTPTHPITIAFLGIINHFAIPFELIHEFMEGVALDLVNIEYNTQAELLHFYHHTAGAVERIIAHILECVDAQALIAADYLGVSIQMINHLRDMRLFLNHDRCYFSNDLLLQVNLSAADLKKWQMTDQIRELISLQAEQARHYYREAMEQLKQPERQKLLSTIVLMELSLALLRQLLLPNTNLLQQQISITPLRKLLLTWRVQWRER